VIPPLVGIGDVALGKVDSFGDLGDPTFSLKFWLGAGIPTLILVKVRPWKLWLIGGSGTSSRKAVVSSIEPEG
jgi:hypothetical protein